MNNYNKNKLYIYYLSDFFLLLTSLAIATDAPDASNFDASDVPDSFFPCFLLEDSFAIATTWAFDNNRLFNLFSKDFFFFSFFEEFAAFIACAIFSLLEACVSGFVFLSSFFGILGSLAFASSAVGTSSGFASSGTSGTSGTSATTGTSASYAKSGNNGNNANDDNYGSSDNVS